MIGGLTLSKKKYTITMGISDEQKAQRDYEILEASMKDQKAKKVIRHIRAEEKEHEKELKGLKKKLPKAVRYV